MRVNRLRSEAGENLDNYLKFKEAIYIYNAREEVREAINILRLLTSKYPHNELWNMIMELQKYYDDIDESIKGLGLE